jgi:hypothetical protein
MEHPESGTVPTHVPRKTNHPACADATSWDTRLPRLWFQPLP